MERQRASSLPSRGGQAGALDAGRRQCPAPNPTHIAITDANVNDIEVGRQVPIAAGCTYVFDKAYCLYRWWTRLDEVEARFVTRMKKTARFRAHHWRPLKKRKGCGFTILDDAEVRLVSKGDSKLAIPMRRIRLERDNGEKITLITNDLERAAIDIAGLYKTRWQIELLFRWIKQHLKVRKFLGNSPNAIRLQLTAAMIAYLLLRIAARQNCLKISVLRFTELVGLRLFTRRSIAQIDKPPDVHPSKARPRHSPDQLAFAYAGTFTGQPCIIWGRWPDRAGGGRDEALRQGFPSALRAPPPSRLRRR